MDLNLKSAGWLGVFLFTPLSGLGASGWTDYANIEELIQSTHGRFQVKLKVSKNPSGCKHKEIFFREYRLPGAQHMYVKLEKAVKAGKKVKVHVTGRCELNGYSEISSVNIQP